MCWFFLILFRASLWGVPMQDFKRAHCSFLSGLWDGEKNLEKGLWCPIVGLLEWDFLFFSLFFLEFLNSNFARILDHEF
jgi:hypothetical protein